MGAYREDQFSANRKSQLASSAPCYGVARATPVTLHDFIRSFISVASPSPADKNGPRDPGARFAAFDTSYRVPHLRNWLTLFDSEVHDGVSPIGNPPRAAMRSGAYLSHVPGIPKLDLRAEGAYTDPPVANWYAKEYGQAMYWEQIETQGYTNQGQLFGDWLGREARADKRGSRIT